MTLAGWLAALAVGLLAGGIAGLVGVGGGVVIVPFLYLLFAHPEWFGVVVAQGREAVLAHATSLFVIVPTSVRGAWLYHRAGLVEWRAVWPMGVGSIVAAVVTARAAPRVSDPILRLGFALLLLAVAAGLWRRTDRGPRALRGPSSPAAYLLRGGLGGLAVGALSVLLGVGGGVVAIPVLIYWLGLDLRKVTATSLAVIVLTAGAGTLSYALTASGGHAPAAGTVGYVHVPAAMAVAMGTLVSVGWGTTLQGRLPERALRRVFAIAFLLLALLLGAGSLRVLAR